ncbi:WD domain-containing protein [Aaosphaeria arxii CBS 175.79]|uniref:WD domain-containing protein n=1 Tax=Aaosphaeria arxii CBS 175.79 TaxID=1450172 RepID=A0A6A5XU93_9PLEO|nr:WD domain-containing protein [Aaosphaeria arxii CBS 175.79]KAF2016489.1 WD domain-containing protein [Aaosphaeria arxii CBS 175.79]
MSRSTDPGHFFQTTTSIEESARKATKSKNTRGNPVKLPSKILAIVRDPKHDGSVYVAEAAGSVKQINIESGSISATFSGPTAPLTSLAVSSKLDTVFAGCWDKSIWAWSLAKKAAPRRFQGHTDFVKAVEIITVEGKELLVSGSSDTTIIVWDIETGKQLHKLKGHSRGILALAIEPQTIETAEPLGKAVTLLSAGTDREIRRWKIELGKATEVDLNADAPGPLISHETSIDSIRFDADGDLWTASADKTAKCLDQNHNWEANTTLEHPDFVRDVVVDEEGGWVVTACRDEEVRVWEKSSGKLHHVFSGHFEEVTGLVLLPGQKVVSVGIDATVRQWSLKAADLAKAIQDAADEEAGKEKEEPKKESLMTEEEERELADLLEESE